MTYVKFFDSDIAPDLSALRYKIVDVGDPAPSFSRKPDLNEHLHMLAVEFSGCCFLEFYHAGLTVHIRRGINLEMNKERYLRLWHEQGDYLLSALDSRWLVSACDTLMDHGGPIERMAALAGALFMNTVKLYETERWATSVRTNDYQPMGKTVPLFDGMTGYKIGRGDMIKNLFARAFKPFPGDLIAPRIVCELIRRAHIHDTVFKRFRQVHQREKTRWTPYRTRRVVLFNDTAASRHYGCLAVMDVISRIFAEVDLEIVHRQPPDRNWQDDDAAISAIRSADIIVVNGEGSIHHSAPRARQLAALGPFCRDIEKPAFLINATLHDNDRAIIEDLRTFSHIWVRENLSATTLRSAGIPHSVCADLSLLQTLERPCDRRGRTIVIDSVRDKFLPQLAGYARNELAPVVVMKSNQEGFCLGAATQDLDTRGLRAAIQQPLFRCSNFHQFAAYMGSFDRLITGCFHSVCFAISMRLPFHAVASNTFKIEATLDDVGLAADRMLPVDANLPPMKPFSSCELSAIDEFIARTRDAAAKMVRTITA